MSDLEDIRRKVDRLRAKIEIMNDDLSKFKNKLKEDFKLKSVNDAKNKLNLIEREIAKLKDKREKIINRINIKLDKLSDD